VIRARTDSASPTISTDGFPGALGRLGTTGGVAFAYVYPDALPARTVNVYVLSAVRPVNRHDRRASPATSQTDGTVPPSGEAGVTRYAVTTPPVAGAPHVTVAVPGVASNVTATALGAPGGPGTTDSLGADGLLPAPPLAVTVKEYDVSRSNPVKVQVRLAVFVQPAGGVTTGLEVTV
jgi:hypothetical protein